MEKEIKVTVRLVAGYRTITGTGRKLEIASSAKLKFALTGLHREETVYQDWNFNTYTYAQLAGMQIQFMDGDTMELVD